MVDSVAQAHHRTAWCLVANVKEVIEEGDPTDANYRKGTRHFSPGTKVYCSVPIWGDGFERIKILAKHRGSSGLICIVVATKYLENFRAQNTASPIIVNSRHTKNFMWDKENLDQVLKSLEKSNEVKLTN